MPLGNGNYGLNLWVEPNGDICFYISGSGAWSGNARLLKLGGFGCSWIRPFHTRPCFRRCWIRARVWLSLPSEGDEATRVEVWVDANYPAVRVQMRSGTRRMRALAESWRAAARELLPEERGSAYGLAESDKPIVEEPDTYADRDAGSLSSYHRNEKSIWADTLRHQGMESWLTQGHDPLLHRTFGMRLSGAGFQKEDEHILGTGGTQACVLNIHLHTAQTESADAWLQSITGLAAGDTRSYEQALKEHTDWWHAFQERSWIRLEGRDIEHINQGYALQRYMTACAGRGECPIKFNGSLFTVDAEEKGQRLDADYRRWGGPYWFQNTRLVYWPMLAAGDTEMMLSLFDMYRNMLPFAEARTKVYFGHAGHSSPRPCIFGGLCKRQLWVCPRGSAGGRHGEPLHTLLLRRRPRTAYADAVLP